MKQRKYILLQILLPAISAMIALLTLFSSTTFAANAEDKPRHIYIVYDNSKSMTWNEAAKEAAYGVELIASMMEEGDKLTIYFMKKGSETEPYYKKYSYPKGNESVDEIVSELHEVLESLDYVGYTYMDGLAQAVEDISESDQETEEAYLVVFSDGDFNRYEGDPITESQFDDLADIENVSALSIYCALGERADTDALDAMKQLDTKDGSSVLEKFREIGNLIYDRQTAEMEVSEGALSVQLELPASRIILLAQSDSSELTSDLVAAESEGLLQQLGTSISSITLDDFPGRIYGAVNIYEADSEELIPSGIYEFSVPSGVELTVYVEYEIEYAIRIYDDENSWVSGEETDSQVLREGTWHVEIRLKNTLSGELLETSSSLYDGMDVEWELDGEELEGGQSAEEYLSEGEHKITCEVSLEGNFGQELEGNFTIHHKLGSLSVNTELSVDGGFDIDLLEDGKEYITVTLLEGGANVSAAYDLVCSVETPEGNSSYQYACEETAEGWKLVPVYAGTASADSLETEITETEVATSGNAAGNGVGNNGSDPTGTYEVTVHISGMADGEEIDEESTFEVSYYATEKTIEMEDVSLTIENPIRFWFCFWEEQAVEVYLSIQGEPFSVGNWITDIQASGENSDISVQVCENKEGETYLKILASGSLTESLDWWSDQTFNDEIAVSLYRYGVKCAGNCKVSITVKKLGWAGVAMILLLIFILYFTFCIVKNVYCFMRKEICLNFYDLNGDLLREDKLNIWYLRNALSPWSIYTTAQLVGLEGVEIVGSVPEKLQIRVWPNGKCHIKNMRELIDCQKVTRDEKTPDMFDADFRLRNDIEWEAESSQEGLRVVFRIFKDG